MAAELTIWHNPRCSKSRATLALLQDRGLDPAVRLYLDDVPDAATLRRALVQLDLSARDVIRKGEAAYKEAGLGPDSADDALIAGMVQHPKLIERPIVFAGGKARIGRPPEAVLDLL